MANDLFTMARCADFERPAKGATDRTIWAFITATEAEVFAAGLQDSACVYDRGCEGSDWVLRVSLADIVDAPRCERCEDPCLDLVTDRNPWCHPFDALCPSCVREGEPEPRERSFRVDDGPANHVDYFARLGRAGY